MRNEGIGEKSNRILGVIFVAFLIILFRIWHLEVVQKEEKIKEADTPKRRTIVLKADRGTLSDRFGIPLAINKICYNATIYYNQISQIPSIAWKEDLTGKHVRWNPRKEYIQQLSEKLGSLLDLDPLRVEDLIHSKASLFPHIPFLLKSRLTEKEYHQLAFLEKDLLGVHAEIASERFYPRGKAGGEIIGSMGSISSKEYLSIAEEIRGLQKIVDDWEQGHEYALFEGIHSFEEAASRLQELKEKAYTIQDLVGKSGIEGKFEQQLRGFYGKNIFQVDQKGKCLRQLPGGRESISGQQLELTVSIELQEFAEALLAEHEAYRDGRSIGIDPETKARKPLKQPWIKGGAIVAIDPNNGEVLAMASTPRFDPNDFIPSSNTFVQSQKQKNVYRWLENERLIAAQWDGREDLIRERFSSKSGFYNEARPLTWDYFLETVLPLEGPFKTFFSRVDDVKSAVQIQEDFEALLYYCNLREPADLLEKMYSQTNKNSSFLEEIRSKNPDAATVFKRLDAFLGILSSNQDRLFAIDLCRLVIYAPAFTDESLHILSSMKLGQYRALNQLVCRLEAELKETAQMAFRKEEFFKWREVHQKAFLAERRLNEKKKHLSPRPFVDYLDEKEKELFLEAWKEQRLDVLASAAVSQDPSSPLMKLCSSVNQEQAKAILHTFRSFDDLQRPLLGSYRRLRNTPSGQTEKHLASAFYPIGGYGHSRSYAFQANAPQGSIFKLITAYAGLKVTGGENPLTVIDEVKFDNKNRPVLVANSVSGMAYPRMYKGGRLPKSAISRIGKIDLIGALEQSSNPYFSILAGDVVNNPEDLNEIAKLFGFGTPTGIDLPGEGRGKLPDDLSVNRTGLYSTAMGQHKLLSTPLQTAVVMSAIANGGKVLKPQLVKKFKGSLPNREFLDVFEQHSIAHQELRTLGIPFPLFTAPFARSEIDGAKRPETQVIRTIDFPPTAREQLLEGMDRSLWSSKGSARPGVIRSFTTKPLLMGQYLSLRHQMIGKTGTAEIMYNPSMNPSSVAFMYKHIWFGAISFNNDLHQDRPELVVIVYLRYGDAGKEAAPLAAQIVDKWREIKKKHSEKLL